MNGTSVRIHDGCCYKCVSKLKSFLEVLLWWYGSLGSSNILAFQLLIPCKVICYAKEACSELNVIFTIFIAKISSIPGCKMYR